MKTNRSFKKLSAALMLFAFVFSTVSPAFADFTPDEEAKLRALMNYVIATKYSASDAPASVTKDDGTEAKGATVLGYNATASGNASTSLGYLANASGSSSTALGNWAKAHGVYSTALGYLANASNYSTALGYLANASADYGSTALGQRATASGDASTALGDFTNASEVGSTALGNHATASGRWSTAIGFWANASEEGSTALGRSANASGSYSTALGDNAYSAGDSSIAIGKEANTSSYTSAVALGSNSVAEADNVVSVGSSSLQRRITNVANGTSDGDAVNYGQFKKAVTEATYTGGVLTLKNAGGETVLAEAISGGGDVTNAVVYDDASKTKITLNAGGAAVKITNLADGDISSAASTDAVNGGQLYTKLADKADKATTLSGYGIDDAYTKEEVEQRIASGGVEVIEGKKYDASDQKATATGKGAFASGYNNEAAGIKSTAVGYGNTVKGNYSGAFGDPNIISGDNSYAVGNNNEIAGHNNFVLGNNVKIASTVENSAAIGNNSTVTESNVISVGSADNKRRIVNVADGINPTDAATVGQVDRAVANVQNQLGSVSTEVREVGAMSAALAGLHYVEPSGEEGDKFVGAVAYGGYRGESAGAIGIAYKPNPNFMFSASTSVGQNYNAYNAGVSLKFGKGETAQTRAELKKQVKFVNEQNIALKDTVSRQDAEIQALKNDNEAIRRENAEIKEMLKKLIKK